MLEGEPWQVEVVPEFAESLETWVVISGLQTELQMGPILEIESLVEAGVVPVKGVPRPRAHDLVLQGFRRGDGVIPREVHPHLSLWAGVEVLPDLWVAVRFVWFHASRFSSIIENLGTSDSEGNASWGGVRADESEKVIHHL